MTRLPDPPGRYRSLPRVEHEEQARVVSGPPPAPSSSGARKPSPTEGIRVQGQGWGVTVPAVVVSAALSGLATYVARPSTLPPDDELRRDVQELRRELRDMREENRQLRAYVRAQATWTEQSIGLTAQVVQHLGGKLEFAPGAEPPAVDFHAPPLQVSKAPIAQPRAVLPIPPTMP